MKKKQSPPTTKSDRMLLSITLTLLGIGVIMVYSASMPIGQAWHGNGYYYLNRQLIRLGLGFCFMFAGMNINYTWWRKLIYIILPVSFVLLLMVLFSPLAKVSNGARRWLELGGLSFQPIELAKWALVVFLAHSLVKLKKNDSNARLNTKLKQLKMKPAGKQDGGIYPLTVFFVLAGMCILVACQPDLGNCLIMVALAFLLFFIAGIKLKYLASLALVSSLGFLHLVFRLGYTQRRIVTFLNPWRDSSNAGFQLTQSFLAIGRGGLTGAGLGASQQKMFYLPEAHTDFILAIMGEELGFLGMFLLLVLFGLLIWRGGVIARSAKDAFGAYLAAGIITLIGLQIVVNMGVVTGLLPTKGLPLPFISYGGSALVINMLAVGTLLNISKYNKASFKKAGGMIRYSNI